MKALEKLRALHPNIVICDIAMPGMTGTELLKQAAEARAEILLRLNRTFSESDYAFRFANSFQQAFTGV